MAEGGDGRCGCGGGVGGEIVFGRIGVTVGEFFYPGVVGHGEVGL